MMILRYRVNQAGCFRAGIDCPRSIQTLEVDPSRLPQGERDLIADRLDGIDVLELRIQSGKAVKSYTLATIDLSLRFGGCTGG